MNITKKSLCFLPNTTIAIKSELSAHRDSRFEREGGERKENPCKMQGDLYLHFNTQIFNNCNNIKISQACQGETRER